MRNSIWRISALVLALAALGGGPVLAQAQTGNVYGTTIDEKGEPLTGVTVTLTGGGAPQAQTTDVQGRFRFVGVYPGTYRLEASLEHFSPVVHEQVVVNVNRNTSLELTLSGVFQDVLVITEGSPLLDRNKISNGTSVSYTELQRVPTARDPWVILQTTPGVLIDRVNVGGNESGQQSNYVGNGDDGTNSTWAVDGVEITDFCAIGSSSSYYDFDAFEEMQVTTGGSDAAERTGGVGLNLVTKRGTNEWRGSGRYIVSDQDWQSDFNASAGDFAEDFDGAGGTTEQTVFKQGNRIVDVADYGAELGGPIVEDKVWVWGSYGKNEIDLLTVDDFADNTQLETWNAKFNGQLAPNNTATVFFSDNAKTKQGRNAGPTRPQETTWNQDGRASEPELFAFFGDRPTVAKIEDTHIFGSSFYLTASYAESDGGFQLIPQGGISPTQTNASLDSSFVFHNTFLAFTSERPQDQYKVDGSYFFTTSSLSHELRFGANYRKAEVRSQSFWPGFGLDLNYYVPNYGYAYNIVQLTRPSVLNFEGEYENAYVQDTLTAGNLTANIGLRYDVQSSTNLPSEIPANPAFPSILPAVSYAGEDGGFEWKTLSPRLGLTYAVGEEKKTLLRASYARFAEQIGGGPASFVNPTYPGAYAYYYYRDTNGDGSAQANEVATDLGLLFNNVAYSPAFPGVAVRSNGVDPNLDAPVSDEITLGVEHALLPEFVVGLTATLRHESDILEGERLVFDCAEGGHDCAFDAANVNNLGRVHTASDYVVATTLTGLLPDGSSYSVPVYGLRDGVSTRGGALLTNSDRERDYMGIALTLNKRLSNSWMLRGNVSWNDWEWSVPASELDGDLTTPFGGGHDGDRVLTCSGTGSGAKAGVCISSAWSYSFSGLYQVMPDEAWGFNLGASLNGREGYANPYWVRTTSGDVNSARLVNVTRNPDDFSNDDVHLLDLRIEKELQFDQVGLTLGVDVFNVANEGTVLQRNLRLRRVNSDHVQEVVSPRIFRLGARLTFN